MPYTWCQVEEKFGIDIAELMKKSTYLDGIGVMWDDAKKEAVYFDRDIRRAYADVCNRYHVMPRIKEV